MCDSEDAGAMDILIAALDPDEMKPKPGETRKAD
jgi:hypothetical protein